MGRFSGRRRWFRWQKSDSEKKLKKPGKTQNREVESGWNLTQILTSTATFTVSDCFYLESVYKLCLFVIPTPYQVRGNLQRVSRTHGKGWIPVFTGITKRNDYDIYGQTLFNDWIYFSLSLASHSRMLRSFSVHSFPRRSLRKVL